MSESENGFAEYCASVHPTYSDRKYYTEAYNWCPVPDSGQDAIFFAGIAVAVACLAQGRFSNSIILLAGAAVQGFVMPFNLGRFGNGVAIWLGIQPYELFFYIFLPPLLLDAAVRIDFFLFKKVIVQVITLAFLVVGGSVGIMIPVMLYVLDLKSSGWNWQYVSLFISMLASTDAVAIISTMKTSGGPKRLRVILEGEALLNDASSFTLFEIFLELVEEFNSDPTLNHSGWSVFGNIVKSALRLGAGGLGIGIAFGIACQYILRFMRWMGASIDQQVSLTLAFGYLSYYVANSPAHVSGVVSVACFGLYGAATSKWDMSSKVEESGVFDAFWDTLSFVTNGIVFFFSGVACINFFVRSSEELEHSNHGAILASTIWRLPIIYIFMFLVRFTLTALFRPMFKIFLGDMTWRELLFATSAGLRGSVSLILAQAVVTDANAAKTEDNEVIKSEIVLWTAGFVLMTLLINIPFLPLILRKTGLNKVSDGKRAMRKRAVRALASHTLSAMDNLKGDEDEMLRGVDWEHVQQDTSVTDGTYDCFIDPSCPPAGRFALAFKLWNLLTCQGKNSSQKEPQTSKKLMVNPAMETSTFFGRTKGWGTPQDLESGFFEDYEAPSSGDTDEIGEEEEEAEMNEDSNELTVGSEFPFLGRRVAELRKEQEVQDPGRKISRARTIANFARTSFFPGQPAAAADTAPKSRGTSLENETGELPASPAKLDRQFKSGPDTAREPQAISINVEKAVDSDEPSLMLAQPIKRDSAADRDPSRQRGAAYIMTAAGPLLAPLKDQPASANGVAGETGPERHDSPSSLPKLNLTGEELRKFMTEGTNDKTWPKLQSRDTSGRPPLPFKRVLSPKASAPPDSLRRSSSLEDQSAKTWAGPRPSELSTPSTMTYNNRSSGAADKKRASVFDAFDIDRPGTVMARKHADKHKHIYEAFGVRDSPGTLQSKDSTASQASGAGRARSGAASEAASPQQTWTAGMTKGRPPPEILEALRQKHFQQPAGGDPQGQGQGLELKDRQHSAPAEALTHPLDILRSKRSDAGNKSDSSTGAGEANETSLGHSSSRGQFSKALSAESDTWNSEAAPLGIMTESEVVESRIRLVAGLKRYFHGKRVEGLLSSAALRILDNACDTFLEKPTTISMWHGIEQDATGGFMAKWLAHQTYFWRKVVMALRRRKSSDYRLFLYTRRAIAWPIRKAIGVLHHLLTCRMLIGIEVGIEYMLGLTYSPHVQLLRLHERASIVIDEVQEDLDKVWKFIMDREVEAPERFRAIQSYRAKYAILKQQIAFIDSMFNSGLVDDMERDQLLIPIERKERQLDRKGPTYRNPTVLQILHNLPFLRRAPDHITEILYHHAKLHMYKSGTNLCIRKTRSLFVVTSGLVKVSYTDPQGNNQEYFIASGGLLGLYSALTGETFPGHLEAVAEGNATGRGPVVVEFFYGTIEHIRKQAAAAAPYYQQIELDLMRLAAIYVTERMKPRLMPYLYMLLSQQAKRTQAQAPALTRLQSLFSQDSSVDNSDAIGDDSTHGGQDMQGRAREEAVKQFTQLMHQLASSEIVAVPAGSSFMMRTSTVLLKGTLKTSGHRYTGNKNNERLEDAPVEYHAPFVFPVVPPGEGQPSKPPLRFVAGYQHSQQTGAMLMVCQHNAAQYDQDVNYQQNMEPEAVDEDTFPEDTAGSEGQDQRHATRQGLVRMASMQTQGNKPPVLRRQSLALIMNANETGELAARQGKSGKKGNWWDNAVAQIRK